ncbi:MAG TPA: ATP-binding protein, partial [Planctomycetota bacterium]|nr:ATP-binding protein [Planctomycetota bacterium]
TEKLASVVDNLVSNALKYARSEVRIALDRAADGGVRLEVGDDGRGVPRELHERIFEEGFQVPGSLPGNGIGLFSVRRAVLEHGGAVSVESEPGKGARFVVRLPD